VLCTSCLGGLYLSQPGNGSCIATCAGTSYFLLDTVNLVCVSSCPSNMVAPGNGTCVLCSSGYQYQGNCIPTCPGSYYADSTLIACLQCDSSCLACLGSYPENCTSCIASSGAPYLLLKMCWSICPKGFYANNNTNKCEICDTNLNCTTCSYNFTSLTIYCTACIYGTFFQSSTMTCGIVCNSSQYKNTWNNSCTSCDSACVQCNGPFNTSCTACQITQKLLTNTSGGYCLTSCPVVGYVGLGTTCQLCDSTCSSCNGVSASQCSNCSTGFYYSLGYCRYICPSGTYPNSTTSSCLTCDSTCTYCFGGSSSNCTSCVSGLYLFNYSCGGSCPNNVKPNQWNICF
jgi:proprotein convertase subtilisin/kexin type 5